MAMGVVEEDEDAQKSGAINIGYFSGTDMFMPSTMSKMSDGSKRSGSVTNALPFRFASMRICYDDVRVGVLINCLRFSLEKFTRLRLRAHRGKSLYYFVT
jgi:hypothetical protein